MEISFTYYSVSLLIAGSIAGFTCIISFTRTGVPVRTFAYMMAGVTVWAIAYSFELSSSRLSDMLFWVKVEYVGIALIPAFWLLFCIRFTEYGNRLNRLSLSLLFLMPVVTLLMVWTNDYHHLHYKQTSVAITGNMTLLNIDTGIWYLIHTIVFYCYLTAGIVLLVKKYRATNRLFRQQISSILLGAAVPWIANIAYLAGLRPLEHLDITPYAFVLTGVLISIGLLRYRLFEILPVAREKIIEEMNEGILILDHHFLALDANPSFLRILGITEKGYLGKPVQRLFRHNESLMSLIKSGKTGLTEMTLNSNGQKLSYEVSMKPLINRNDVLSGYFLIFHDVTQKKLVESDMIRVRERAEAASRAKSEFLANMSHEIRTPLNGVIGFSDLLMKTELSAVQRQYMSSVHLSANSLLDIINDILDFSKIEAGKLELSIESTDLRELCEQSADIVSWQVQDQSLNMILTIEPQVPRFVMADAVRLRQILVNLLSNALKFTARGEIELRLQVLEELEENQKRLRFSVRDTGIGIEKKNRKKIFKAFAQKDYSITRKYNGTGLGLTISNKLLFLMGSSIKLNSKLGDGSTFYFDVVFEIPETASANKNSLPGVTNGRKKESSGGAMVSTGNPEPLLLIVDDNPVNVLLATSMISRLIPGARIRVANNGLDALEQYGEEQPDLIFMDIRMPEMSGYEATRRIRELEGDRRVPIIALTAGTVKGEKEKCLNVGMDDYIAKPFVLEMIESILNQWLYPDDESVNPAGVESSVSSGEHFNSERLKKNLGLDDSSLREILVVAEENIGVIFSEIENAVKDQNKKALADAAHKLKGTSGTLCFEILAEMALQLEKIAEISSKETRGLVQRIEKETDHVRRLIRSVIS